MRSSGKPISACFGSSRSAVSSVLSSDEGAVRLVGSGSGGSRTRVWPQLPATARTMARGRQALGRHPCSSESRIVGGVSRTPSMRESARQERAKSDGARILCTASREVLKVPKVPTYIGLHRLRFLPCLQLKIPATSPDLSADVNHGHAEDLTRSRQSGLTEGRRVSEPNEAMGKASRRPKRPDPQGANSRSQGASSSSATATASSEPGAESESQQQLPEQISTSPTRRAGGSSSSEPTLPRGNPHHAARDQHHAARERAKEKIARTFGWPYEVRIDVLLAMLADSDHTVREPAQSALYVLDPTALAQHNDAVVLMLAHSDFKWRAAALLVLAFSGHAVIAQCIEIVVVMLEDPYPDVRERALWALMKLEPARFAQHADAFIVALEDAVWQVRWMALGILRDSWSIFREHLEPAALAQLADAVVPRLEDSAENPEVRALVRFGALTTLSAQDPTALTQYADAVVLKLAVPEPDHRCLALLLLRKMGPTALAKHASAVLDRLEDTQTLVAGEDFVAPGLGSASVGESVRDFAVRSLRALPGSVTRDVDFEAPNLRSRLLGRAVWYRCRRIFRVRRIAFYWYALPYRHARDMEEWMHMNQMFKHVNQMFSRL